MVPVNECFTEKIVKEMLTAGVPLRVKIRGFSMLPLLRPGDMVELRAPEEDIKKGDVVIVKDKGTLLCHRVVNIDYPWVYTGGDFSPRVEGPFHIHDVLAVVIVENQWKIRGWIDRFFVKVSLFVKRLRRFFVKPEE